MQRNWWGHLHWRNLPGRAWDTAFTLTRPLQDRCELRLAPLWRRATDGSHSLSHHPTSFWKSEYSGSVGFVRWRIMANSGICTIKDHGKHRDFTIKPRIMAKRSDVWNEDDDGRHLTRVWSRLQMQMQQHSPHLSGGRYQKARMTLLKTLLNADHPQNQNHEHASGLCWFSIFHDTRLNRGKEENKNKKGGGGGGCNIIDCLLLVKVCWLVRTGNVLKLPIC